MPFTILGGESPPTQLLAGVVVMVPSLTAGLEVLLVDGKLPTAISPPEEPTARTACRVFQDLTGVRARASPLETGFVDLTPAFFYDHPSDRPVTAMLYSARLPAKTKPTSPGAAWAPVSGIEDDKLRGLVSNAAARS